jgi:hypothetical protein
VRTGAQVADGLRAVDLASGYLPAFLRDDLTRRARSQLALNALRVARRQRDAGDLEAAWANLSQGLECSQALEIVNALAELFQKGSGTVAGTAPWVLRTTVSDPFWNSFDPFWNSF